MKKLKNIFNALLIATTILTVNAQETNYLEILDPVYLSQSSASNTFLSSYEQLNKELIEKGELNFRKEIREARKNNELLILNGNISATSLEKVQYLKIVRKAANKSETVDAFYEYLNNHIPVFNQANISDNDLFKLYDVIRKNTTNGKLEIVSEDLSWL